MGRVRTGFGRRVASALSLAVGLGMTLGAGCSSPELRSLGGGPCGQAREVPGPLPLEADLTTFERTEPLPLAPDCTETTGSAGLTLFRVQAAGHYRVSVTSEEDAVVSVHALTGEGSDCTEAVECAELDASTASIGGAGGAGAALASDLDIELSPSDEVVVAVIGVSASEPFDYTLRVDAIDPP